MDLTHFVKWPKYIRLWRRMYMGHLTKCVRSLFWHWTGHPAKEGPYTLRQMAQVHPSPEAEGCPPDQAEDPTPNQPVHSDPRQADSHQPVQALRQVQARD